MREVAHGGADASALRLVFLPIVLAYTAWVYRVMAGPVTAESIGRNPNAY